MIPTMISGIAAMDLHWWWRYSALRDFADRYHHSQKAQIVNF
jgi:hypothetical protein